MYDVNTWKIEIDYMSVFIESYWKSMIWKIKNKLKSSKLPDLKSVDTLSSLWFSSVRRWPSSRARALAHLHSLARAQDRCLCWARSSSSCSVTRHCSFSSLRTWLRSNSSCGHTNKRLHQHTCLLSASLISRKFNVVYLEHVLEWIWLPAVGDAPCLFPGCRWHHLPQLCPLRASAFLPPGLQ